MVVLVRRITPKAYLQGIDEGFGMDYRLLGMAQIALIMFNSEMPTTYFRLNNIPQQYIDLIAWGAERQICCFMMAKYALIDISYSDMGFSINVNRVEKLKTVSDVLLVDWMKAVTSQKNAIMLRTGAALVTPRMNSFMNRALSMLGDGAYGWSMV